MKHKQTKAVGLRRAEKDKARRTGILRLAILSACTVIVAAAALFFLVSQDVPDSPADPNQAASVPAQS